MQGAGFQVLRRCHYACSDVAMVDQTVLQCAHQQVDTLSAQALTFTLIGQLLQRHTQPGGEVFFAGQYDVIQRKALLLLRKLQLSKE